MASLKKVGRENWLISTHLRICFLLVEGSAVLVSWGRLFLIHFLILKWRKIIFTWMIVIFFITRVYGNTHFHFTSIAVGDSSFGDFAGVSVSQLLVITSERCFNEGLEPDSSGSHSEHKLVRPVSARWLRPSSCFAKLHPLPTPLFCTHTVSPK